MTQLSRLPDNLPIPDNDGACDHLRGLFVPSLSLPATTGEIIDLRAESNNHRIIVYCYPMTGDPNKPLPNNWDIIPGARGCTPQSCAFRDHYKELQNLDASVYGISTQTTSYQQEMVQRLHLPFPVLSDADLIFIKALNLPTFCVEGMTLVKRVTLILSKGMIEHIFYPVFPPNENAEQVVKWLKENPDVRG